MNIDVIGIIYTGGTYDANGNVITASVAQPGYHVNVDAMDSSLASYEITPATPSRLFAGCPTFCLQFTDEAEFKSVMAKWIPTPTTI